MVCSFFEETDPSAVKKLLNNQSKIMGELDIQALAGLEMIPGWWQLKATINYGRLKAKLPAMIGIFVLILQKAGFIKLSLSRTEERWKHALERPW